MCAKPELLLAEDCSFKETGEMIRGRIGFETNSRKIREKSINERKTMDFAKT